MKKIFTTCFLFFLNLYCFSQIADTAQNVVSDTVKFDNLKKEKKKKVSFGVLPVISFDSDMGFQYGGLVNFYDHAKGTLYPDYRQMVKIEISRYTKGSGVNQLFWDAKHLLPRNLRLIADFSFLTEQKLDFFGFNGALSKYEPNFIADRLDNQDYISRVFYSHSRRFIKFNADIQGQFRFKNLKWLAGFGIFNTKISSTDIEKLNKKLKKNQSPLPDVASLYDKYVEWGLISEAEKDGGWTNFLKLGLILDTRDNEYAPNYGIWSEILVVAVPNFLNSEFSYTKLEVSHRQYFTLIKDRLVFAYRIGYQGTVFGDTPFFMQTYQINSVSSINKSDGLGGAKNLRGIMRNRVVGDGFVQGIAELRCKIVEFVLLKQNITIGLNGFFDYGQVVQNIKFNKDLIPEADKELYFDFAKNFDRPHAASGAGLRIAINHNFILAADYGFSLNKNDGLRGLYISIGNIF